MEKNFFEQELRKLFENSDALTDQRFAGRVCMARLTDTTSVKLEFVTRGTANQYEAIKATVINRNEGQIDSAVFRFADIIGKKTIPNYPDPRDMVYPHFWKYNDKYEWYAYHPTPRDFEMITDAVGSYLEMFQDPIQSQGMYQQMS